MSKKKILLIGMLLLAVFLRFYQLGINPPSIDWDEASLGYNAYSLLKTGRDEFGRLWPVSIRSFEDYKPAVYTYLTMGSVALFGLTEFATRLPSAVLGILSVLTVYFLSQEYLFRHSNRFLDHSKTKVVLLTTLLFSISPWHLQFSRVAFEANVALFFMLVGVLFFFKGLHKGLFLIVSTVAFVLSFYSYHSPRLVIPLLLIGWSILERRRFWELKRYVFLSLVFGILLLVPLFKEIAGAGAARFSSVTVFTSAGRLDESIRYIEYDQTRGDTVGKLTHNRRLVYILAIVQGYLDHFNLDFLFLKGDGPLRHHAVDMGMLYQWTAPFILVGLFYLIKSKQWLLLWWFLVAPAASAMTTGTPHAVRALFYLPLYQVITATGIAKLTHFVKQKKSQLLIVIFTGLIFINMVYYLDQYYTHTPIEAARDWQYGYKQVVEEIGKHEHEVDKVIMTYSYDQPHVFVLFFTPIDPLWYQSQVKNQEIKRQERSFGKYEFRNIDWASDRNRTKSLLVGTPGEIPEGKHVVSEIFFPDGTVAFRIAKL